jgi:dihydrofolate reductase
MDGCCDHAKMNPSEDVLEYHTDLVRSADILLYGRKTYELMVPYWPDVAKNHSGPTKGNNEFAQAFDAVKNFVVFSKTLNTEEKKTKVIRANLRDEILKLKQEPGKSILVGGVDLPSQLIQLGLVDEYHFVVQPTIVGEGRRLFDNLGLQQTLQLKLVETKVLPSGCVALRHAS